MNIEVKHIRSLTFGYN